MTEIFEFTSLARNLTPFSDEDDRVASSFAEIDEEGEETGSRVVVKREKPNKLAVFWNDSSIIVSSNHQVASFDGTHFTQAKQVLLAAR